MTGLTPARRAALLVVAAGESRGVDVRISNRTSDPHDRRPAVYHQTASWLVDQGLALEELGPTRDGLRLTPAGRDLIDQLDTGEGP